MVGVDGWTHRVLEGPLATSTQTSPGEKSFTSALTLAEEFIREDAVDAQSINLKDYLKETAAKIVSEVNVNYSDEQNINIDPFIMAYSHQGQSGFSDFILEKSSELIYNILEAFFIRGIDLSETREISDLDAKETEEEENSATTSTPIVTLDEEEEPSVITPVPVITLEDESKDIFDLSSEADQLEKEPSSLSQEINWTVQELIKSRSLPKKRPSIVNNEPCKKKIRLFGKNM